MGNCWVLSKYYHNDPLIKSKGCHYGGDVNGKLIEGTDMNKDTMVLVKRRGIHCPNIIHFEGRPQHTNGTITVCSMLYSGCKKCEYHIPSCSIRSLGRLIKYPTCKLQKSINPLKETVKDTGEIIDNALEQANKMMGKKP